MSAGNVPVDYRGPQHETPLLGEFPPLFKNRNFLLLWAAYVISALGDRIHFLVMLTLLEKLKRTVDPAHQIGTQETAQLNIMMLLPFLALGPITGVIADRLPRRLVMIGSDFARVAIVIAARTLFLAVPADSSLHHAVSWFPAISYVVLMLLVSELLLAVFSAFFSPARTALLPNLVHPDQLLRANSMTNAAGTIASLVGFILGAALVKWHLEVAMYVDAGTFLVSGLLLLGMRRTSQIAGPAVAVEKRTGFFSEFADGVKYVLRHKRAMQVILLMFLFWCGGAIILSGLTGVVTKRYHKDVDWFGYFLGVVGIGMMAGAASVSLARRGLAKEFGIAWSMTIVGVFLFLFSIPDNWGWALAFLVVCGFFGAILLVSLDTLLQRIVPDFVRGRVMAARDMVANIGLVGVAVPLAIDPNIDEYIVLVLRIVAGAIIFTGLLLMYLYYRGSEMPVAQAIGRRFASAFLSVVHGFERGNACRLPTSGPAIFVSNHTSGLDPLILAAASRKRFVRFMMAKEWYAKKPLHYLYKALDVIPVNRTGNDIASIRNATRALESGGLIGMFPEGGISDDGRLLEPKQGVALLALMSKATVCPGYVVGTNTYKSMFGDFFRRSQITVYFAAPMRFDDVIAKYGERAWKSDEAREEVTRRIMGAIIALRDKHETNPERRLSSKEWNEQHGKPAATSAPASGGEDEEVE